MALAWHVTDWLTDLHPCGWIDECILIPNTFPFSLEYINKITYSQKNWVRVASVPRIHTQGKLNPDMNGSVNIQSQSRFSPKLELLVPSSESTGKYYGTEIEGSETYTFDESCLINLATFSSVPRSLNPPSILAWIETTLSTYTITLPSVILII